MVFVIQMKQNILSQQKKDINKCMFILIKHMKKPKKELKDGTVPELCWINQVNLLIHIITEVKIKKNWRLLRHMEQDGFKLMFEH